MKLKIQRKAGRRLGILRKNDVDSQGFNGWQSETQRVRIWRGS